jgi:hypothetical protein
MIIGKAGNGSLNGFGEWSSNRAFADDISFCHMALKKDFVRFCEQMIDLAHVERVSASWG